MQPGHIKSAAGDEGKVIRRTLARNSCSHADPTTGWISEHRPPRVRGLWGKFGGRFFGVLTKDGLPVGESFLNKFFPPGCLVSPPIPLDARARRLFALSECRPGGDFMRTEELLFCKELPKLQSIPTGEPRRSPHQPTFFQPIPFPHAPYCHSRSRKSSRLLPHAFYFRTSLASLDSFGLPWTGGAP
jgi:hypothetical protein